MLGAIVLGSYRVDKELGAGAMGAVYRAVSAEGHHIAVKVMHPHILANPAMAERFRLEAQNAARIRHPHILQIMATGQLPDGRTYIAMEFLQGVELSRWMADRVPLDAAEALPILIQLADALHAAHRAGVIHRDIKPDNVMLCEQPIRGWVKVVDFGISKRVVAAVAGKDITADRAMMGTPSYMAPEQAGDAKNVTAAADLFSLGIIAIEMLTGRRPYAGPNDSVLEILGRYVDIRSGAAAHPQVAALLGPDRRDVPPAWLELLQRAIDVEPTRRPRSARAFIEPLYGSLPGGRAQVELFAPSLIEHASPDDPTTRHPDTVAELAAAVPLATLSGRHTAPPLGVPTTLGQASGQVATQRRARRPRWPLYAALGAGAAAAAVTVVAVASGSSAGSGAPPRTPAAAPTAAPTAAAPPIGATPAAPVAASVVAPVAPPPVDAGAAIVVDAAVDAPILVDAADPALDARARPRPRPRPPAVTSRPPDGLD